MRIVLLISILVLAIASSAAASERDPLFAEHETLKAVLTAPISQTYAQRDSDVRLYFPGQWTFLNEDGESQRLDVERSRVVQGATGPYRDADDRPSLPFPKDHGAFEVGGIAS